MAVIEIRPFEDNPADWETMVDIGNRFDPARQSTVEQSKARFAMFGDRHVCERFFAERDGVPAGFGVCLEPFWIGEPNKKAIFWATLPDELGSDLERNLFDHLIERAKSFDPDRIHGHTLSIHPSQSHLFESAGFTRRQRLVYSEVDVQGPSGDLWAEALEKLEKNGLRVVSLEELSRSHADWKERYLELFNRLGQDIPFHTDFQAIDMPMLELFLAEPGMDLRLIYLADDNGRWVGISELKRNPATPERLSTGFTGVDRDYRRRGVAMGLKGRALLEARRLGAEIVGTDNDENNPMLQLNYRLGFKPEHDLLLYARDER